MAKVVSVNISERKGTIKSQLRLDILEKTMALKGMPMQEIGIDKLAF